MGNRIDPGSGQPDWVRGQRGWGSPAATPPAAPCNFQQDAFTVNDWDVTATPAATQQIKERDETAADMFLNWVYSKLSLSGFANGNWIGINNCNAPMPTDTGNPGDARSNFMSDVVLPTLATYVPTPTP